MNALKIVLGMLPIFVFSLLPPLIGVGWAAVAGTATAAAVVAATARGGVKELPASQGVLLLIMSIIGFTSDAQTQAVLVHYGPAIVSLALGVFILATARSAPFTAQFARPTVSPTIWHNPRFVAVNTRMSATWGVAILVAGLCHVVGAQIGVEGLALAARVTVNQVLPLMALLVAGAVTKRMVTAAKALAHAKHLDEPPDGAATRGAHEAGQVRS